MSDGSENVQDYATYRQIGYWWLIYMVLDVTIWSIFIHLHAVYLTDIGRINLFDLSQIWVFFVFAIIGKMGMLQFPFILLLACVFRKKLRLETGCWVWLPCLAYLASYTLVLGNILVTYHPGSAQEAWQLISREWLSYRNINRMFIPIALISTLVATVPWTLFLKRQFRVSKT